MKTAADVVEESLRLIGTDIEGWLALFADDAVVEFPYAKGRNVPERFDGKPAIATYYREVIKLFSDLRFRDIRIIAGADPELAVAEAHGTAFLPHAGKTYEQDYVMVLRVKDGKAIHYREYWNPTAADAVLR